jgi:nucleoside phosphorylase
MILCAGEMEQFEFALPIGIGLIESAINLSRLCLLDRPEYLLFIGTAGSYGKLPIGSIITSTGASQIESSFAEKKSYSPIENAISISDGPLPHQYTINSSNYITADRKLAEKYRAFGLEAESMEFFSVMAVARHFQIPAAGIFYITNTCFENAHDQFIAHHPEAMATLDALVRDKLAHLITKGAARG